MKTLFIFLLLISTSVHVNSSSLSSNDNTLIQPSKINNLTVVSFNTWGLPFWLPKVGINNRYEKAVSGLIADQSDIICLQECFSKRLRKKILNKFQGKYHFTLEYQCDNNIFPGIKRDCHGGLMTFSKLPIIDEEFVDYPIYDDMKKTEKIGHKGMLISKLLNQTNDTIIIINTHLYAGQSQADEAQRFKQVNFMKQTIQSLKLDKYIILLTGDLNIDHPDVSDHKKKIKSVVYKYLIEDLAFIDSAPKLHNDHFTVDGSRNPYCNTKDGKQKLDYVFMKFPKQEKWLVAENKTLFFNEESYSDHLAWKVEFSYN